MDDLHSQLDAASVDVARPSLADGHRFGRWLDVEVEPRAREALEKACLLERDGDPEEAIEVLGKALDDEERACLFEARGALYLASGFPRAAVGDFQRAVASDPGAPRAWFGLGHAYEILGLSHQALESLRHALDLGGEEFGLHLSTARVYHSLGHPGLAARHYEQALERIGGSAAEGQLTEIQVEIAVLATEDTARAARVQAAQERLQSCGGAPLSGDAWILNSLLKEMGGESAETVGGTIRSLEVSPQVLASLTHGLITAVQLADPETASAMRADLLAREPDAKRRQLMERSLQLP